MKKLIKKLKHHLFLYKGSKNYATYIPERSDVNVTTITRGHYSITTYKLIPIKILGIHVWYKMEPTPFHISTLFERTVSMQSYFDSDKVNLNSLTGSKIRVTSVESKKCEDGRTIECIAIESINQ
jgi:hypothetical protein